MFEMPSEKSLFPYLKSVDKPIYIYGMGNGAEKLKRELDDNNIPLSGIFASDEFVRGHSFLEHKVIKYSELPENAIIVLAFGSFLPELLDRFDAMAAEHEFFAPDLPLFGEQRFDESVLTARKSEIEKAYSLLCDEQSRLVFKNTILHKISGKISYLRQMETDKSEIYESLLKVCENEHYLDLGAYDGDTVRELLSYTNQKAASITAVEPDPKNFKKLINKTPQAKAINKGVYNFCGEIAFSTEASRNSSVSAQGKRVIEVDTIDNIVGSGDVTYIKMDVEGSEKQALLGGEKTILRCRPRLLVSAYHKMWDFFELVNLLGDMLPNYKLYLRHQPYVPNWETNIIAIPAEF